MTQKPTTQGNQPVKKAIDRSPLSVLTGALYPLRALGLLITLPRLRQYILVPILLNLVVGITLYAGLLFLGLRAIDMLLTALPAWLAQETAHLEVDWSIWTAHLPHWNITLPQWQILLPSIQLPQFQFPNIQLPDVQLPNIPLPNWLSDLPNWGLLIFLWLLRLLLVILLLLLTGFVLLQFGVLLGAPWYGKLSEELEKLKTGQLQTIEINPFQEIGRAILYELKKLVLTIGVGIPLLLFNFFPGIGTAIATVGGITLAATIVCLDFLDAALERRRLRFRHKLGAIVQSLPASASFGLICLGLVSIPLLNLLAIPVCVAAGTLFACDRILPQLPDTQSSSFNE